jgi:hypothetical protein
MLARVLAENPAADFLALGFGELGLGPLGNLLGESFKPLVFECSKPWINAGPAEAQGIHDGAWPLAILDDPPDG